MLQNDASSEELSREELGRLVASRWTGGNTEEQSGNVDSTNDSDEESHDIKDTHDNDGYASETDDDNQKYGDDLEEDFEDNRDGNHDDSTSSERYYSDTELDSPGWKIIFSIQLIYIYNIALAAFSCEKILASSSLFIYFYHMSRYGNRK